MTDLNPLIVILGPTASGKTGLALALAKEFGAELVNADSRQIYRGMDIATNKISGRDVEKKELDGRTIYLMEGIPVHLIDIIDPDENFSLVRYKQAALESIDEIHKKDKLPILVGGTGLYISAVVDNLDIPHAPADDNLRQALEKKDAEELFNALSKIDPDAADSIGARNKRKLIRALEVYKATGQPFSSQKKKGRPLFDILELGLKTERTGLYARIDERVDEMMESGHLEETQSLLKIYSRDLPAMSGIGYREMADHLEKDLPLEEAIQQIKYHTHQYARRQITWFKRDPRIHWIEKDSEAQGLVKDFLK